MGRALWITFTVIFTSLLLYLAFVGHREQMERVALRVANVMGAITSVVERVSLPEKKQIANHADTPEPKKILPQVLPKTVEKPQKTASKNIIPKPVPVAATDVALANIEYSANGEFVLVGSAKPGAQLDFLIDGIKVEKPDVKANGDWKLTVPNEISSGPHRLEVSVQAQAGREKMIVVMPFVKAKPEEIAALTNPPQTTAKRIKPEVVKPVKPQVEISKTVLPQQEEVAPRKTSPGFSKLARLARSQSVKSDADPLIGLLPRLMLGEGPTLVRPQLRPAKTDTAKPDVKSNVSLKIVKPSSATPDVKSKNKQPELVEPLAQGVKILPNGRQNPPVAKKLAVNKPELVEREKPQTNTAEKNKQLRSALTKKRPYTGPKKISVPAGRGLVVVQPGNTLWDLAISIYGSSRHYQKLYRANRRNIGNPQMIFPGQIIFAPGANPPTTIAPLSPPQWMPPQ